MMTRVVLLCCVVLASAMQFRPLPNLANVQVVSSPVLPGPTVTAVRLSQTSVADDNVFSIDVRTNNCDSCQVAAYFVFSGTPLGTSPAPIYNYDAGVQYVSDGHYNTTTENFFDAFPNGVYQLYLMLHDGDTRTRTYTYEQLNTAFPGQASITVTSQNTPVTQWATLDFFQLSTHTITSYNSLFSLSTHVVLDTNAVAIRDGMLLMCTKQTGEEFAQFSIGVTIDAEGWANLTNGYLNANADYATDEIQSGGFDCSLVYFLELGVLPVVYSASALRGMGYNPTLTLTGSQFVVDAVYPACNLSLPDTSVEVSGTSVAIELDFACDEAVDAAFQFGVLVPGGAGAANNVVFDNGLSLTTVRADNGVFIPEGFQAGSYGVWAAIAVDSAGNAVVYSNHNPPVSTTQLFQALGTVYYERLVIINQAWAAQQSDAAVAMPLFVSVVATVVAALALVTVF